MTTARDGVSSFCSRPPGRVFATVRDRPVAAAEINWRYANRQAAPASKKDEWLAPEGEKDARVPAARNCPATARSRLCTTAAPEKARAQDRRPCHSRVDRDRNRDHGTERERVQHRIRRRQRLCDKPDHDNIKVVYCGSGDASLKVVGKVDNKTQTEVSVNSAAICKPFPTATTAYWKGKIGKPGYVLCLAPLK
ncbi:MAG TPA: hypothetical protein VE198_07425 [Actinoallomurus sp.]|nr:hypothetical protein [Actinoallomurus sp.]